MARVFREKRSTGRIKLLLFIVVMIAVLILISLYSGKIASSNEKQTLETVKEAIVRASVQCYALEGRYPPSLSYLEDNYGITINEQKYLVHFRSEAENMMPDIRVFVTDKEKRG